MQKYNVCVKKTYTKDGEEKSFWPNVGTIVIFPPKDGKDEGGYLELNMNPDVKYYVFPAKSKEDKNSDW